MPLVFREHLTLSDILFTEPLRQDTSDLSHYVAQVLEVNANNMAPNTTILVTGLMEDIGYTVIVTQTTSAGTSSPSVAVDAPRGKSNLTGFYVFLQSQMHGKC